MGAVVGWLLFLLLAGLLTAIAVVCLVPREAEAPPGPVLDAVRRTFARARRAATGGESGLARLQRELYNRAIEELPRSRSGAIHLPGRIDALVSSTDAVTVAGFEHVVESELADEVRAYVAKFAGAAVAVPDVHLSYDPTLRDGAVRIELSQPTVIDVAPAAPATEVFASPVLLLVADTGASATMLDRALVAGRSAACDLVIADPRVSGRHCEFARAGEAATVTDVGSTNGTSVNGAPISATVVLSPGDQVTIGTTTLTVTCR
jgi:FHA domain